eukprot:6865762-Prymnesium_polylepis.1
MSELEGSDEDCNETTYFEFKTFFKSLSSRVMERRCKNTVLDYAAELRAERREKGDNRPVYVPSSELKTTKEMWGEYKVT